MYYIKLLNLNWSRRDEGFEFKAISISLLAWIIATLFNTSDELFKSILIFLGVILSYSSLLGLSLDKYSTKAIELINKYSRKHNYKHSLGLQADVQGELIKLLQHWIPEREIGSKKIILFVEDIDRCEENRIIQVIDALRILLEEDEIAKRVIIISAIDERILRNAIQMKYANLDSKEENSSQLSTLKSPINLRISEYLDKLFISAIKLGDLSETHRLEYLEELVKNDLSAEKNIDVNAQKATKLENRKHEENLSAKEGILTTPVLEDSASQSEKNYTNELIADNPSIPNDSEEYNSTQNTPDEKIENEFTYVTQEEIANMKLIIKKWEGATPRQIRIFYYRYLLCKNILIKRYTHTQSDIWRKESGIKAILSIILDYTINKDSINIQDDRQKIIESLRKNPSYISFVDTTQIKAADHIALLEVLEIVVAY